MTLASRLYYGVVDVLPYVVVGVGLISTILGAIGLYQDLWVPDKTIGLVNAGLPFALGLFLVWSGWSVLQDKRRDEPEE
jgi:type III secretory pathway component EscR